MARKNGTVGDDITEIEREIGKLMQDLETRVSRLNTLTRKAGDYVSETLAETLDRLRNGASDATDRLRNGANAVTDEAARLGGDALRRVEDEVAQRPLLTLAIAAGIGYLAGMAGRRH
jgi:ElaB/YqjD/DUF883 family membrane-anchored ribosome-binding protein